MKRKYKKNRKKARSPFDTYSDYYDKLAKKNSHMMMTKYNKEDFEKEWYLSKMAGLKNPAIMVARSQRKWEYQFSRRYKKATGIELTGLETDKQRQNVFMKFAELYPSYDEAREAFEALY